mmetsp:Transcript_9561/g.27256  ORF Transcript_9561/g.27256 Transcript_9561/m.27256 type:complete len:374 (-) Transcript_9561:276-1397(-)
MRMQVLFFMHVCVVPATVAKSLPVFRRFTPPSLFLFCLHFALTHTLHSLHFISFPPPCQSSPNDSQVIDIQSPQSFLDNALEERGYSVRKFCSLEGGYYCRPTPLQQASYGCRLSQAVRSSDATLLRRLLDSGLSPNPCNSFGESLVHMICRRGDHKLLRIMLEAGCSLQVTDDYGRTPLHDACWKADPSFETVQLILDADKNLLNLMDCRGSSPLSYVSKDKYPIWIQFLSSKLDRFWPRRDIATEGVQRPPALALRQPHSMPIQDPLNALPLEVAAMVSNGRMEPEEALYLDDSSEDDDSSYDSEDDSIYSDDDDYDSEDEDSEFDQAEMAEICLRAGGPMAIAQRCFGNKATTAAMAMGRGGGPSSTKMA